MKKIFFMTTILVVFLFVPFVASANVIINEIAWMGTKMEGIDPGSWWRYEWLELYNSGEPISLDGWKIELYRDNLDFTIQLTGTINDYFLIVSSDKIPNYDFNYSNLGGKFNNNGQKIVLKDNQGNVVEEINCFSVGWFAGKNDTKQTMERITTGWQTSLNPGGTPKAQNSSGAVEEPEQTTEKPKTPLIPTGNNPPIADAGDNIIGFIGQEIKFDGSKSSDPDGNELAYSWNMGDGKLIEKLSFTYKYLYPGTYLATLMVYDGRNYVSDTITIKIQSQQITINEFMANPSGKDEEDEWIEIYNDSDSIVDISGWQLDDIASGSKPFVFPQNTLIAPKSYLVFSRQITKIALNNDKDSVRLLFPEGVVFQEITYEKPPQGKSSARTNEGFVWNAPTPGAPNISGITMSENKNITYQYQIKPETTKEPSQDYAILYQNEPGAKIEGGYTNITIGEGQKEIAKQETEQLLGEKSQLATIKGDFSKQSQTNLIFIILAIIIGGLIIGLILTKFLKKSP